MLLKKNMCILVVSAMMLTASCADKPPGIVTDDNSPEDTTDLTPVETEYPEPDIEAINCGGREFKVAVYDENVDARIPYSELGTGEQNGEVLNDAMYKRNLLVSEKYNLVIKPIEFSSQSELLKMISSSVLAGTKDADLAICRINDCMNLGMNGYAQSFDEVPHADFAAPWWLGGIISETSIAGQNYIAAGYANTRLFEATGAVYFNKVMLEMFNIENPYELVNSGGWTLDKFMSICRGITSDLDGNSVFDLADRYGFVTNNANWMQFFASCGGRIVIKNADDLPELAFGTEKTISLLEDIIKFMNDQSVTLLAEKYTGYPETAAAGMDGKNRRTMIPIETFTENRALFAADIVASIRQLRNMDADFGVLPPPKYSETQEDYISYIHPQIATGIIIPVTNNEMDLMGRVLEDMMYQSYVLVRPAMFEIVLNDKYTRDSDSAKSFDKILGGASLDLGLCLGLTIDNDVRVLIATNNIAVSSIYQQNLNINNGKIQDAIKAYTD